MSGESLPNRQHVVNGEARQARSAAGDAFTMLVVEVAQLGAEFTARGEGFAKLGAQTLARWVILDAVDGEPLTVAEIARRRGMARQGVQRVADVLEREGLAAYESNPHHRRAKLLRATLAGRAVLEPITKAQIAWANSVGERIGEDAIAQARATLDRIRAALETPRQDG